MTLAEIKNMVMFQTNNDADDLGDFLPYLETYINDGYDRLAVAFARQHVTSDSNDYTPLSHDKSSPNLPEWSHQAIADWATWLIYRNGNVQKQNRGMQYRAQYAEIEAKLRGMTSAEKGLADAKSDRSGGGKYIYNIPR